MIIQSYASGGNRDLGCRRSHPAGRTDRADRISRYQAIAPKPNGFWFCQWGVEQTNYVCKFPKHSGSIPRIQKTTDSKYIIETISEWFSSMRMFFDEFQGVFFHGHTNTYKYRISHMCLNVFMLFAAHKLQLCKCM